MTDAKQSYLGAKNGSGVFQAIINVMPPHDTYIEAFLGTGAIMRRKAPAKNSIGIEINPGVIDKFDHAAESLNLSINLINANAITYLKAFSPSGKTVIYLDPPYVHSTRTSNARYKNELTDADHAELLTVVKHLSVLKDVFIIISGYRNPLYDTELADWYSKDFQAMTRGGVRTETVWCSFHPGEQHYHTFAGKDFTDRQRIKRKAARWAKNFEAMPAAERQAVMAALLAIDN
ncbi:DNA adenine methylase [Shewanella sp. SW36]|uniref:DNA adenine methylase n=1 Tax=unclassified Shewanella TaxID=196818 RepID=UPI0021D9A79E|nr:MULTISPECIES: DNA adenine methylase [unclassified Shewanella]MCU7977581.1 DNA adenine methylase [Shewanella sp. SW36]MCU7992839.1 DNA adenine methylase [Shewanella sp. SW1]MCU8013655.1 DNA adenine methylase [Shewanella sp. SM74]MCU8054084.1 DNA adenine methylase [Shewanella sp. SM43]